MIGWYVDVGISKFTLPLYTDVTWLYSKVPWTVAEGVPDENNYEYDFNSVDVIISRLTSMLGDDFFTVYGYPTNAIPASKVERLNTLIPSFTKASPDIYEETGAFYFVVRCPSLGWVYSMSTNGVRMLAPLNTDSTWDASLWKNLQSSGYVLPTVTNGNPGLTIEIPYRTTKDRNIPLSNSSSWGRRVIWDGTTAGRTNLLSFTVPSIDSLIFPDGSKPDFDIISPDNPYEPGGPSGPTDPDLPPGTFDDSSDPIPDSSLPTISAADTGFTRIYNPTLSQVQALAQYLWTTPDVIATIWNHIKQFFENPMDAIIGFNLVPVPVPDGGTTNFKLMYIDTGVAMTAAANQFVDVDCGTLKVKRYYGSALDQSPYTKVSCFLPYIGTVQLNTDEVMGATLQVKYRVDICSGSCVAKIFIDGNCIYQYSGHCAINIPISSADFSSYVSAAINVAKLAVGAATAGAGGAAMAAAQVAGSEQQTGNMVSLQSQGGSSPNLPAIYQGQPTQPPPSQTTTSASFAGLSPANVSNTVGEIMNAKPHVEHSGSFSGNTGYLGVRRPFIIIERPNMCMPENYQALNGFPAMITMELSTCKGFTRVQQVQLTGMTATNPEQAEILELLKSGVIL